MSSFLHNGILNAGKLPHFLLKSLPIIPPIPIFAKANMDNLNRLRPIFNLHLVIELLLEADLIGRAGLFGEIALHHLLGSLSSTAAHSTALLAFDVLFKIIMI